jgi:nitrogen regulatory protein PII
MSAETLCFPRANQPFIKNNDYFFVNQMAISCLWSGNLDHNSKKFGRTSVVKKIEAIIRPLKLDEVKIALGEIGVTGMSVTDVRGSGRQGGHRESFGGTSYVVALPMKIKLEIIARDEDVDEIVSTIEQHARTGDPGDGKIFVLPMTDAVRIRTEERGDEVL